MSMKDESGRFVVVCDTPHCEYEESSQEKSHASIIKRFRRQGWYIGNDSDMCPKCARRQAGWIARELEKSDAITFCKPCLVDGLAIPAEYTYEDKPLCENCLDSYLHDLKLEARR